jgi:hypothetical protein
VAKIVHQRFSRWAKSGVFELPARPPHAAPLVCAGQRAREDPTAYLPLGPTDPVTSTFTVAPPFEAEGAGGLQVRSRARFSRLVASCRMPWSADFTTSTPESEFSVRTGWPPPTSPPSLAGSGERATVARNTLTRN